jgi:replicative DNA helicase
LIYKEIPKSEEAEQELLGQVLSNPECLEEIKDLIPSEQVFYSDMHQILWRIISDMYDRKEEIGFVTVVDNIPKKDKAILSAYYISGLLEGVPTTLTAKTHAKKVYEKWLLRKTIEDAETISNAGKLKDADAYELVQRLHDSTYKIINMRPSETFSLDSLLDDTIDKIYDQSSVVKYGYGQLDQMTGGMTRGEISVIAGRPGHGKTTLSVNIVRKLVHQGYKVLVFNREMPNKEMMKKIMVMESKNLSYYGLRSFNYGDKELEELHRVKDAVQDMYKDNLIMFDHIRDLGASMRQAKKIKPDVIVDDYIQIIDVPQYQEKRLQISEIMKSYKWLAKDENLSVLLVSQLNRELERRINKRPQLSDLAESGSIEQDAETVIFNYYPWKYLGENHELGKRGKYQIHTIVGKSRYAETGFLEMGFHGDSCCVLDTRDMAENKARIYGEI